MTRAATENTTTAPIEMEASLELLGKHAAQQLQQGHIVKVGGLGTYPCHIQERGCGGHHAVQRVGHDQEPAPRLHTEQGVPRAGTQRASVPERRRAGERRQLRLAG